MTGLLVLLLTGLALLWGAAVCLTVWMLTHPPRRTYGAAVARGRAGDPSEIPERPRVFQSWAFRSRGMEFPVWDIPGDDPHGPVMILTHGWADSRIGALVRLLALAEFASRIIAWDLPGHGKAPGLCRLGTAEVQDLLALIEHIGPLRIVLVGWSLGAGISIAAAIRMQDTPPAGLILESPYRVAATPATNVLRARGVPASLIVSPAFALLRIALGGSLSPARFDRALMAESLKSPVLVLHGEADSICPSQDGQDIAAAAGGECVLIPEAGHNDLWTDPEFSAQCQNAVRILIRSELNERPDVPPHRA